MQGRCRGDVGEIWGRYRGDIGEIGGRYRGDMLLQVEGLDGVHVLLVTLAHRVEAELHLREIWGRYRGDAGEI